MRTQVFSKNGVTNTEGHRLSLPVLIVTPNDAAPLTINGLKNNRIVFLKYHSRNYLNKFI